MKNTTMKTPPLRVLPVLEKAKTLYKIWISIHRKIPRTERFGIGLRTDNALLDLLETLRRSAFASGERKITLLDGAIGKVDDIRFLFHLLWETGLISESQFILLGEKIEEIGRDVGGWRRGILAKTSAQRAEEKR